MHKARRLWIVLVLLFGVTLAPVAFGQVSLGAVEAETADGVPPGPRPTRN